MNVEILRIFDPMPGALPLYEALEALILQTFEDVRIKVGKMQISFYNKHLFAAASLPIRKIKNQPEVYFILTFGLDRQVVHPRIWQSVEPYPNRWTHHLIISQSSDLDAQVLEWLRLAYDFAMIK